MFSNPIQEIDALGLQGWASAPIFNGSLPGNQAATSKSIEKAKELTKCGKCGCGSDSGNYLEGNEVTSDCRFGISDY